MLPFVAFASCVLLVSVTARLDKPLIKPEIPPLDGGLFKNLKPTHSTHDQWEWGCKCYFPLIHLLDLAYGQKQGYPIVVAM